MLFKTVLELFDAPNSQTINKALIEVRDSEYVRALTMAIMQEYDFDDIIDDNVDVITRVIGKYIQKFPFDSSMANSSIRALHNALKDRFPINFYNYKEFFWPDGFSSRQFFQDRVLGRILC